MNSSWGKYMQPGTTVAVKLDNNRWYLGVAKKVISDDKGECVLVEIQSKNKSLASKTLSTNTTLKCLSSGDSLFFLNLSN